MHAGIDLWTSGTDVGCDGKYTWCNDMKELMTEQVNWLGGKLNSADGDCIFARFSNKSVNASTSSFGNCAELKSFLCEVSEDLCNKKWTLVHFAIFRLPWPQQRPIFFSRSA